jgi:hypothetical protein
MKLKWIRNTDGVIFEGKTITLPYPPKRPPHLPLSEEILVS